MDSTYHVAGYYGMLQTVCIFGEVLWGRWRWLKSFWLELSGGDPWLKTMS